MAALATLDELKARLDWTLDAQEESLAETALEDASTLVRGHGLEWTPENVPPIAKTIALGAARRFMVNHMGVTVSRAGDETLTWDGVGDKAGTVYLTREEKQMLAGLSRPTGFGNLPTSAWDTVEHSLPYTAGMVPVSNGHKKFPLFNDDTEPW